MNWTCGHCGMLQISTESNSGYDLGVMNVGIFSEATNGGKNPRLGVQSIALKCANELCSKVNVSISLHTCVWNTGKSEITKVDDSQFYFEYLYPKPNGKPFSSDVPEKFLADYREAWSIIDLSPKSSATLARRCLQGMIRDFCGIKKGTLFAEIEELEKLLSANKLPRGVDQDTVDAMRALKDIGNIGAHMTEIDGVIVDVDPNEAKTILEIIEIIFSDWYVARARRKRVLAEVVAIKDEKKPPVK